MIPEYLGPIMCFDWGGIHVFAIIIGPGAVVGQQEGDQWTERPNVLT